MQSHAPKKTKLARNTRLALYAGLILIAVFALLAPTIFYKPARALLRVNGTTIGLDIARTQAAQEVGLGGRKSMPTNEGMLFVFARPTTTCFWMKGMQFPLDIIWLNRTKQVLSVQAHALPSSYPQSFCPSHPAQYVIELNAGQVAKLGIMPGKTLSF